jgi:hypothetical protein
MNFKKELLGLLVGVPLIVITLIIVIGIIALITFHPYIAAGVVLLIGGWYFGRSLFIS